MSNPQKAVRPPRPACRDDEADLVGRAIDNAALLRAGRLSKIDAVHLAEESEDLGKSERRSLGSHLRILGTHRLRWQYQPGLRGRVGVSPSSTRGRPSAASWGTVQAWSPRRRVSWRPIIILPASTPLVKPAWRRRSFPRPAPTVLNRSFPTGSGRSSPISRLGSFRPRALVRTADPTGSESCRRVRCADRAPPAAIMSSQFLQERGRPDQASGAPGAGAAFSEDNSLTSRCGKGKPSPAA